MREAALSSAASIIAANCAVDGRGSSCAKLRFWNVIRAARAAMHLPAVNSLMGFPF